MLTQSLGTTVIGNKVSPVGYPAPTPDQFGAITGHAGLIATEFSYKKDEEIYSALGTARTRVVRLPPPLP
jgi:CRP/FNR family nitrogen fixation transcriptional regulator